MMKPSIKRLGNRSITNFVPHHRGFVLTTAVLIFVTVTGGLAGLVQLKPETMMNAVQSTVRWRADLVPAEMDVAGIRVVYLHGGQGDSLVLLHGFGGEKDNFAGVADHLTPAYRVIIPDLPGFGESGKPESADYGIDDQVEHVHAFIRQLGLKNVSLGGSSMGGWIAGAYAAKYPDEVRSLWLLAPAGVATAPQSELMRLLKQPGGVNPLLPAVVQLSFCKYLRGGSDRVMGFRV